MVVLLGIRKVRRDVLSDDDLVVNIVGDSNESTIELIGTLITTWAPLQQFIIVHRQVKENDIWDCTS